MNRSFSRIAIAAVTLAGLAAIAAPARADEALTQTRTVAVGTLDLRRPADQAVLRQRVIAAARAVCGPWDTAASLGADSYDRCLRQAEGKAIVRVNALIAAKTAQARFAAN